MIKFIAADLDGTLLNSSHELPQGFTELISKMYDAGITFAAASGRQYYGVEKLFGSVRDKMMFIAENGGAAYEKGKCVYSRPLPGNGIREIIGEAQKLYEKGVRILLSGEKSAYAADCDPDFAQSCETYCAHLERLRDISVLPENDSIIKIALFDKNAEKGVYSAMQKFAGVYNVILSNTCWVDIVSKDVNKGTAVSRLMERLGAGYDEAMVFGDYLNDLEMMECCKYSFAMENAHPALKKAAHFIAPSNDENGVVSKILEHIPSLAERI